MNEIILIYCYQIGKKMYFWCAAEFQQLVYVCHEMKKLKTTALKEKRSVSMTKQLDIVCLKKILVAHRLKIAGMAGHNGYVCF